MGFNGNVDQCRGQSAAAGFGATQWSQVRLAAQASTTPASAKALEQLCCAYWYPLYAYVRGRGSSPEDAEDLTQAFFAQLVSKNYLASADPGKGRFRSFLLTAFKSFLADEYDKARAQKRGGGCGTVSLDALQAEARYQVEPIDSASPDVKFERRWALELLDRAQHQLRNEFEHAGKAELYEVLAGISTENSLSLSYKEAAQRSGLNEATLRSYVHRMHRRKGWLIREEIAQTVVGRDQIDEEIRYLMTVLRR